MLSRHGFRLGLIVCSLAVGLHFWRAESAPPAQNVEAKKPERDRHLEAVGATNWHGSGVRGAGIRVAVLDTGFRGYRDLLGTALPAKVMARSFRRDGNLEARDSNHGVMCAEVIHTLAPDAELVFANW